MRKFFMLMLGLSLAIVLQAQDKPAPSPLSKLVQKVGLTDVTIEYSRPSIKGRTIFATDGLVPFDQVWRTGANAATKITFSDDVKVGGKELAAGSYAVTTKPGEGKWVVNFYTHESTRSGSYASKEASASVMAKVTKSDRTVESFTINIDHLRDNSAMLEFIWENTIASVELEVK